MDIQVIDEKAVAPVSKEDRLLETVLASGNIEVLERYIALRKSEEERQARIMFDEHFAALQAELPAVVKSKANDFLKSKYAPLETLQAACNPVIFKHGFSYSWHEESIEGGKRVYLDISGYGHTRSNYFDAAQMDAIVSKEGKQVTNTLQVGGIMSSYGRRYSFISGFGLIIEGEESDGQIPTDLEVLKLDLQGYMAERDVSGKLKLTTEACAIIKSELDKEEPDLKRLQAFHKKAGAKCRGIK
jgi:hypothetical protein